MAVHGNKVSEVETYNEQFAKDIDEGLSSNPKRLPSKYFYDEIGDRLFVKIMNMPEYYLTDSEFEILSQQTEQILEALEVEGQHFELYELGAGDGTKTIELLKGMEGLDFEYLPIDISENAIDMLGTKINEQLPGVKYSGKQGDYFKVLKSLESENQKVVLFLGSNIGNMMDEQAHDFMEHLSNVLVSGDMVLLGVDLKKSKEIVLPAYNDAQGLTRDFNLNLLSRINRELGGNFDINAFDHQPNYDETEGIASSHLKSLAEQEVKIEATGKTYHFEKDEEIHVEISRKYDDEILQKIISGTGLKLKQKFTDSRGYFCDYLLIKE